MIQVGYLTHSQVILLKLKAQHHYCRHLHFRMKHNCCKNHCLLSKVKQPHLQYNFAYCSLSHKPKVNKGLQNKPATSKDRLRPAVKNNSCMKQQNAPIITNNFFFFAFLQFFFLIMLLIFFKYKPIIFFSLFDAKIHQLSNETDIRKKIERITILWHCGLREVAERIIALAAVKGLTKTLKSKSNHLSK